ncbi:MAG: response regulator [Alphaproteobacteria bacterium]|nr:response regulator [Alphaproteobacteria bacterium]
MKLEDLRVLIVDDNGNMRRLINTILRSVNVSQTMEASSGVEALQMLQEWPADIALVDYVMDGLDGVEFTRIVRRDIDKDGRRLPIIMITGYSELWRLKEAKNAGANDFIVKPFTTKTLIQRIARVMTNDYTLKELEDQARAKQPAAGSGDE